MSSAPTKRSGRTHIVILGGGFGGVYAAKYLTRLLSFQECAQVVVSVVAPENYLVFQPMLPEVISGTLEILHVISPIRRIVPRATLYVRAVEEIDIGMQRVRLAPGHAMRHLDLTYDHLVLALGNRLARGMVPGLDEHAIPFKYLGDALRLRNHLVHALEEAAIAADPVERERLLTFVVAGGGFSGVECIAEMHDFLARAFRAYPTLDRRELRVVLLQSGEQILPEMKPSLADFAHRKLAGRGVEIRVNTRLIAATQEAAVVKDKSTGEVTRIGTRTIVATVPVEPHPLLADLPLPKESGRIGVTRYLHCAGHDRVWAIGDCAAVPLCDGRFAPPTAQHAVREARCCAQNIIAHIRNQALRPFSFESLGSLASLGRRSAVAEVMGVRLSGILAWLLWRIVYLSKFPGLDRKVRILADWMLDLFLLRDITEVRIFRHAPLCREHFEPGETVFHSGDIGDRVYFVISGEAEVEINGNIVERIGPGGVFGELALMNDFPRTATIRARTPMNLAAVPRDTFDTLVSHLPGVRAAMDEIQAQYKAKSTIVSDPSQPAASTTVLE